MTANERGQLRVVILLLGWFFAGTVLAQTDLPRGQVFFRSDFNSPSATNDWTGQPNLDTPADGSPCLRVESSAAEGDGSCMVAHLLPVEAMRGYTLHLRARVQARNISQKPAPWNGVKFMLEVDSPDGKQWPAAQFDAGSFGWKEAGFSARIPAHATQVRLCLGLEKVTGTAWFDDLVVSVGKPPRRLPPQSLPSEEVEFSRWPRMRGAMVSPSSVTEKDLQVLGKDWGANLVRWQLIRIPKPDESVELGTFDGWLESELHKLDQMLPVCEKNGLKVVLDLHSPPGGSRIVSGYIAADAGFFTDRLAQAKFLEAWQRIAKRYKENPSIWGYDLVNEPVEGMVADDCLDWHQLAEKTARAVRAIDSRHVIIIEPNEWGSVESLADFLPVNVPGVVYSAHMYVPSEFTHQNVFNQGSAVSYPGVIQGKTWDRAALEKVLSGVRDFQKLHHARIYIGEFSAIRWAPDQSAYRYLRDVIEIFEDNGWDWSYHAFREWQGWSVEHGESRSDTRPTKDPTQRQLLLQEWFKKNLKAP